MKLMGKSHINLCAEANNVNGIIPKEIEQFNKLRYLYLEGATAIPDYTLQNLKFISGTIPSEVQTLSELIILDLNFNKLEGPVSNCWQTDMKIIECILIIFFSSDTPWSLWHDFIEAP